MADEESSPEPSAAGGRAATIALRAALVAVVLPLVVALLVPPLSRTGLARSWVERSLSGDGYRARLDRFALAYTGGITLEGLALAVPERAPFLSATRVTSDLDRSTLPSTLRLTTVVVDGLELWLDRLPVGDDGGNSQIASDRFDAVRVRNATVNIGTSAGGELTLGPVSTEIDSLRGGDELQLNGVLEGAGDSARARWLLKIDPARLDVRGEVAGRFTHTGDLLEALTGVSLPAPLAGVSGDYNLAVAGTLRGTATASVEARLRVPQTATPWMAEGEIALDTLAGELEAEMLLRPPSGLPKLDAAVSVVDLAAETPSVLSGRVRWADVGLRALFDELPGALDDGAAPPTGTFDTVVTLDGSLEKPLARVTVDTRDLVYSSPDFSLRGDASVAVRVTADGVALESSGAVVRGGTVAWGDVAASFDSVTLGGGMSFEEERKSGALDVSWKELSATSQGWTVVRSDGAAGARFGRSGEDPWTVQMEAKVGRGRVDYDNEGLELTEHPLELEATLSIANGMITSDAATLSLGGLGSAKASDAKLLQSGVADALIVVEVPKLAALRDEIAGRSWQPGGLDWSALEMTGRAGGTLRCSYDPSTEGGATVAGLVELRDASIVGQRFSLRGDAELPFRLRPESIDLTERGARIGPLAGSFDDYDLELDEGRIGGSYRWGSGGREGGSFELAFDDLGFSDDSGLFAGEGLDLTAALAVVPNQAGRWSADVNAEVTAGDVIRDRFYADLSTRKLSWHAKVSPLDSGYRIDGGKASVANLGEIAFEGAWDPDAGTYSLESTLEIGRLGEAFELFVSQPYSSTVPSLAETSLEGSGKISVQATSNGEAVRWLSGELSLGDLSVDGSDVELSGLRGSVPVYYGSGLVGSPAASGDLSADRVGFGPVPAQGFRIALDASANRLEAAQGFELEVLGGRVAFTRLAANFGPDAPAEAIAAVRLRNLRLNDLAEAYGGPDIDGLLSGDLHRVEIAGGDLSSEGTLVLRAFGGHIRISGLAVRGLFSRVPTLVADIAFEDVDLGLVTSAFPLGHVSGLVRGQLDRLTLAAGEIAAFDGWFETVANDDVPQRISLDAVRQLAIVGGTNVDPLTGSLLGFFDDYRYAKMGLKCRLRNDRVVLAGVDRIDNKELLIIGSWLPPTLNVIMHGQEVSISDMQRRLRQAGAITDDATDDATDNDSEETRG